MGIVLSFLSNYQRSVLQELGITSWVTQAEAASKSNENKSEDNAKAAAQTVQIDNAHVARKPISSEEKQSRLAQLRAQVSGGTNVDNTTSRHIPEENVSLLKPLSHDERKDNSQWLADMTVALSHLDITLTVDNIMIGTTLTASSEAIILPTLPNALTSSQKKALWMQLTALSSTK